ncbi:MAG: aminoacyl-tRNA hydrolase [Nitrospirae bacterium]|nr:aminoacyl-tRNA hydrolase [Nitrospirota bacterium]
MWIIAGLGNPGKKYKNTRHNVGFRALDILATKLHLSFASEEQYSIVEGMIQDNPVILLKPLTYMNLSGIAVAQVLKKKKITPENLIVIHDDLDLLPGKIKIKKGGSSGGHKGIKSIIECLDSSEFIRVKIGIGRPANIPLERYVLEKIPAEEMEIINNSIKRAVEAAMTIVSAGLQEAMTVFNRRDNIP